MPADLALRPADLAEPPLALVPLPLRLALVPLPLPLSPPLPDALRDRLALPRAAADRPLQDEPPPDRLEPPLDPLPDRPELRSAAVVDPLSLLLSLPLDDVRLAVLPLVDLELGEPEDPFEDDYSVMRHR